MTWERYRFLYPRYEPNYVWLWPQRSDFETQLSNQLGSHLNQVSTPILTSPFNSRPRRAICLDLDETLVKTWERRRRPSNILDSNSARAYDLDFALPPAPRSARNTPNQYLNQDFNQNYAWGLQRPYLKDFLQYCRQRFDLVLVWTAGNREYAQYIVKTIFDYQPDAVYSREHCTMTEDGLLKPLERLYRDWSLQPSQLLMVDNNHTVILPQDQANLIHIPDYEPNPTRPDGDNRLWQLQAWLQRHDLDRYDLRQLPKDQIFSQ